MADTIITTLGTLTGPGSSHPVRSASGGSHTIALRLTGTGALVFAGALEGANDPAGPWSTAATLAASGTGSAAGTASMSSDYAFWRLTASTLTGTGVQASAVVSSDPVAGGGSGSPSGAAGGAVGALPNYDRPPTPADNTTIGITAAGSTWQAGGVIYETVTAPTATSATWQVAANQGGLPEPVLGAATLPFMGGTIAGKPGITTKAVQLTATIGGATVTQDIFITTGEFDVKACASFMARADAGTLVTVTRVYHQLDDTVFAAVGSTAPLLIVWDPALKAYALTGDGSNPRSLRIPQSVTVSRNNFGLILWGRGANVADSGQTGCQYAAAGDNTTASGPFTGIAGYGLGGIYGSSGASGNHVASGGAIVAPDAGPSIVGINSDPSTGWTLWANEQEAGVSGGAAVAVTLAGGHIGSVTGTNGRGGQFRTLLMVITNATVSAAKRTQLRRWMYRAYGALPQSPDLVAVSGDSRATGTSSQYNDTVGLVLRQLIKSHARVYNIANGGAKIGDIQANVLPNLQKLQRVGGKSVYLSVLDVNDINTPENPEVTFARKLAEVAAAKALGFKVIVICGLRSNVGTLAPNGIAAKVNLDALATMISAAGPAGMGADAVVNVSTLQSVQDPLNTAYYPDSLHQSGATTYAMMSLVAPVVDSLLAS